jgi:hypothetical protein
VIPFALRVSRRIPRRLGAFHVAEIMAARTHELRLLPRVPRAFTVRPAEAGDAPLLDHFFARSTRARRQLSAGDTCLMALGDGAIQALEWVRCGPSEYREDVSRLGVSFKFPAGSCWLHNGRNLEREVMGPWGVLMGRLRAFLEPRGVEVAYLQVAADNSYSVACHESVGFRRVGRVVTLHLPGTRLVGFHDADKGWSRVADGELDLARLGS